MSSSTWAAQALQQFETVVQSSDGFRVRDGQRHMAEAVAQAIARYAQAGSPIRAVMLARLGPNVWHDTPAAAMAVLEELEETARLWMLCQPRPTPLTERQIEELRQAFGAQW